MIRYTIPGPGPEVVASTDDIDPSNIRAMTRVHKCDTCGEMQTGSLSTEPHDCVMLCPGTARFDHRLFRTWRGRYLRVNE
jgi:hypothetical protein